MVVSNRYGPDVSAKLEPLDLTQAAAPEEWAEGGEQERQLQDERLLKLDRVQLAAALIDYDDDEIDHPSYRANQSAVLVPFRHILSPVPSPSIPEPGALQPGRYSTYGGEGPPVRGNDGASGPLSDTAGRTSLDVGRSSFGDDLHRRYSQSQFGVAEDDPEEEERLAGEWGLSDYMSHLGSGGSSAGFEFVGRAKESGENRLPFPGEATEEDHLETRSQPDMPGARDRTSTFTLPSADAFESSLDKAAPRTRLRILERPSGSRSRTQSALELPTFESLPSFSSSDPTSILHSRSPALRPTTPASPLSGRQSEDSGSGFRRSMSLSRPLSRGSMASRPISRQSFGSRPISRQSYAANSDHLDHEEPSNSFERPQTSMSARPMSTFSTTPSTFTSRFDPTMLALAKEELAKDRPVFTNKEAGAPPKVVLMPAPLAGRPLVPPKPPRAEGPDPESEPEELEGEAGEQDGKKHRPAGALYGRSLMDVLEERALLSKARARQFVPGQDGRRSMMDWGKAAPGEVHLADMALEGSAPEQPGQLAVMPRSRTHMSIFGPDLVYQRENKIRIELDRIEAQEREEQERRDAEVWEREKKKKDAKKGKNSKVVQRLAAEQKLEGRSPSRLGDAFQEVAEPSSPVRNYTTSPQENSTPRARRSSVAPSLSMPAGLDAAQTAWFSPPSPSPASEASSSSEHQYAPARHRAPSPDTPTNPSRRPHLRTLSSAEQANALRTSVMMGKMSPEAAAKESARLGLGTQSSADDDSRPLGERLSTQLTFVSPPKLHVKLSTDSFNLTPGERTDLAGLSGSSPEPPTSDDEDEDDVPLGIRKIALDQGDSDDDEIPLGLRHASQPALDDEDDRPLGLAVATPYHQGFGPSPTSPYFPQAQAQAQAQAQQAHAWMLYQQSNALAMQSHPGLSWGGSASAVGGGGGQMSSMLSNFASPGEMDASKVERWRRGISMEQ
ncbi:hypothetical protein P7C70_g3561, partial [Phenoliferia sp. Uapishka_3]